ncbi:MAG TPA: histidinol-phosphate transaminase [Candidatus Agrococcus pullicola]|uniref:Histidinol-phosphate aminotransferase n=1 Tax=Candidatus Agrococcus pullicola TaxID=2838429 RepID=A0A9D1YT98_9MICO|nr:histidinol-phosphate transaminase [Candidatus Agrococcus pullicola]
MTSSNEFSLRDLPLRPDLVGLEPYGAPQLHVPVQLNVNESAFDVPEPVVDAIVERIRPAARAANRYPDREFTELRERLANFVGHGVVPEQVWAANGSNEVLQHVLQAFGGPGRKLLSFSPTYSMYGLLAQGVGMEYVRVPRREDFTVDAELVSDAIEEHEPDIVILCGPNNPTGTGLGRDAVLAACASGAMVVVDEAYVEFSREYDATAIPLLESHPRLLISRTMSKAFAFAGVRLGYLIASPVVTNALRLVRLPYHLSALTQAAACAALEHAHLMLAQVDALRQQRDRLVVELRRRGFSPYPSDANFVLVGGIEHPEAVFDALLAEGIIVRNVGIESALRITAGTEAETTAVLEALQAIDRQ